MSIIKKIFKIIGPKNRSTMKAVLEQAAINGLNPNTAIDVGAAYGTKELYEVFPQSKHILIEPLEEFSDTLEKLTSTLKDAVYTISAAYSEDTDVIINVHPDLVGSSLYLENEQSDVNGYERTVRGVTLDSISKIYNTKAPYLIKIDTQGSELEVLKGANKILQETELIIMETSLFNYYKNGPVLHECIDFMADKGFLPYDVFDLKYRLLDNALSQIDIAFVKKDGNLRKHHFYATKQQRDIQNKQMSKRLDKKLSEQ